MTEYMTGYDAESVNSLYRIVLDIYEAPTAFAALQKAVKQVRMVDATLQGVRHACAELRPMADIGSFIVNHLPPGARIEHVAAEDTCDESWAIHIPSNPLRLQGVWGDTLADAIAAYWQIAEGETSDE